MRVFSPASGRISFFSLPLEIRNLIYENLLVSPIPLPPTPPQSEQHIWTAILRANRHIYNEAVDFLYGRNCLAIHLRSNLNQSAYEPFLSNLSVQNAMKIKEVEIVLWGRYNEEDGDTVSFGTENFGIALQNLVYAPKLVVCIDIETQHDAEEVELVRGGRTFCAFDWVMATFADQWFFNKTYFDLFRAVARFHMGRMFPISQIKTCESGWFKELRANAALKQHERTLLWDLEDRYALTHEDDEERPSASQEDGTGMLEQDQDTQDDIDDEGSESNGNAESEGDEEDGEDAESSEENATDVGDDTNNEDYSRTSG
ncbi:hypothetical protein GJ744_004460 [Endocarpon pusillum]|uniref:F-box domain-containing protein n=1 Tax=Endocarpon pusillum TaxID=364733 RepID=A0A8H7EA34_9EURO|nr:hypothetical protein GJ744_004460 [Endocarpon pusillum]